MQHLQAELVLRSNCRIATLADLITEHDALAIDVADGLLTRRVPSQTAVHDLLGARFNVPDFAETRRKAAWLARRRFRKSQVTGAEVYQLMRELVPGCAATAEDEAALETELFYPDAAIALLPELARRHGKPVWAVNNTFLTDADIRGLLSGNGAEVDDVLSPEMLEERSRGTVKVLYLGSAQQGVPNGSNLRIAPKRAVMGAETAGFMTAARDLGNTALHWVMGAIQHRMPHLAPEATDIYLVGYSVLGPVIFGFCKFLADRATEDGAARVVLTGGGEDTVLRCWNALEFERPELVPVMQWDGVEAVDTAFATPGWQSAPVSAHLSDEEGGARAYLGGLMCSEQKPDCTGFLFGDPGTVDIQHALSPAAEIIALAFEGTDDPDAARRVATRELQAGMVDFVQDIAVVAGRITTDEARSIAQATLLGLQLTPEPRDRRAFAAIPQAGARSRPISDLFAHPLAAPAVPPQPDIPEQPDMPEQPEIPEQPDTPEQSDMPDQADMLQQLDLLATYDLILPRRVLELAKTVDFREVDWKTELVRRPFRVSRWLAAMRYQRRMKRRDRAGENHE